RVETVGADEVQGAARGAVDAAVLGPVGYNGSLPRAEFVVRGAEGGAGGRHDGILAVRAGRAAMTAASSGGAPGPIVDRVEARRVNAWRTIRACGMNVSGPLMSRVRGIGRCPSSGAARISRDQPLSIRMSVLVSQA